MSSNSGTKAPDPAPVLPRAARPWSLAARLTAWYAGSAFALVLASTGFLYWASVSNLDREDDQVLGDRVRALRTVMQTRPGDVSALRREVDEEWEAHEHRVHIRITDEQGRIIVETPGMSQLLPSSSFPVPTDEPGSGTDTKSNKSFLATDEESNKSSKERWFRVLAVRSADGSPTRSVYAIQVAMDRSEKITLLAEYRKNFLIVLGASLLVCAFVGYRLHVGVFEPIHNITETARPDSPDESQ